jgi:peroxiredoxin
MKRWPARLAWIAIAVLSAATGLYFGRQAENPAPPAPVQALLNSNLPDYNGQPAPLTRWQGRPMLVNFWATWCSPCVEEMPELQALQTEMGPDRIQIIGIGIDSSDNIRHFAAKHNISYPLLVAQQDGLALARGLGNAVGGLPFTVLLDAQGNLKKTYLGRLKLEELRADLALPPSN